MAIEDCKEAILSQEYRDFIYTGYRTFWRDILENEVCRVPLEYSFELLYATEEQIKNRPLYQFPYFSIPKCYAPADFQALNQAGISRIQNFPGFELYGEGVIIGFIDTGIQYESPVFRNLDGSTRILRIWDQTIQTGKPPEGLPYGSEYTAEDINQALHSENPETVVPSRDLSGHGTYVASVACGSADVENQFQGAAPEAEIVMVKLKEAKQYLKDFYFISSEACYQENDILSGLFYLHQLARKEQKPLIICLAMATSMGGHSGASPVPAYMEVLGNSSMIGLVAGAGNEADKRHHYLENIRENAGEKLEINVGNGVTGFTMEIWTEIPNVITVSVRSPTGTDSGQISIGTQNRVYDFILEQTRVSITYRFLEENTTAQIVLLQFDRPLNGIWEVNVYGMQIGDGVVHAWLPQEAFLDGEVFFLRSNPDYTVMAPGNTGAVACAAYYNGRDKSVAVSSGRGYTRTNLIKPDFATPGINVLGINLRGQFVGRSGSSVATAITAGAEALLMEWLVRRDGTPDSIQLKNLLILGTQRTDGREYPNREWGYGTLDLYQTFDVLRRL